MSNHLLMVRARAFPNEAYCYSRDMALGGPPALGISNGFTQSFLQPSWQHFSLTSQLASSKQLSSKLPEHTRGSTIGQKPGLSAKK